MRTIGIFAATMLILVSGSVIAYKLSYSDYRYRYRLTLAIEVDGRVHTGSSVIEIKWAAQPYIPGAGSFTSHLQGQAVLVDLGERGAVVAALVNGESYGPAADGAINALWLVPRAFGRGGSQEEFPELPRLTGRRDLSSDNTPRLIWFSNIADPKSARRFKRDQLPVPLGATARISAAYVEITRDPIVIDIDKKLPWYPILERPLGQGAIEIEYGFTLSKLMFVGDQS